MARIRSIKPGFFRHEALQDLEAANPGKYIMLTYAGLWTLCDSKGRFEYKPRLIKLDILPFLEFSMPETLEILSKNGFIEKYSVEKNDYGFIKSFEVHQRITGKEASEGIKFPEKQKGNNGETPGKHQVAQEEEREMNIGKDLVLSDSPAGEQTSTPKNKWIETFEKRKDDFKKSLYIFTNHGQYKGPYTKDMVAAFFDYWSEPNKSKSRMRWESEKTWDLSKRLHRWSSKEYSGKNASVIPISSSVYTPPVQPVNHQKYENQA